MIRPFIISCYTTHFISILEFTCYMDHTHASFTDWVGCFSLHYVIDCHLHHLYLSVYLIHLHLWLSYYLNRDEMHDKRLVEFYI